MAKNYRELIVWQKAMDLVEMVYTTSSTFPKEEKFGLTSQLQRAAISIPSNIAEGSGRMGEKECIQFLKIAHGSLSEVETQMMIAQRLHYIDEHTLQSLLRHTEEIGRLINGLRKSLLPANRQLQTAN